jgi:hypothetical protein
MPLIPHMLYRAVATLAIAYLSGCATGHSVALVPTENRHQCGSETTLIPLPVQISGTAVLHYLILPFGYSSHDNSDLPLVVVVQARTRGNPMTLPPESFLIKVDGADAWFPAQVIEATVTYRYNDWSHISYSASFGMKRTDPIAFDLRIAKSLHGCGQLDIRFNKKSGMFTQNELGR